MRDVRVASVMGHVMIVIFFFNDTATTEIYTLSLHDALPICWASVVRATRGAIVVGTSLVFPEQLVGAKLMFL